MSTATPTVIANAFSPPAAAAPRRLATWLTALGLLALHPSARALPIISEFMASNHGGLADDDGDNSDWIELYNPDATPANLGGWFLTDDADKKKKWVFPAVTLPAHGYLVVFASGRDRDDPAKPLHTNFALAVGGGYLGLIQPDGVTVASEFAPEYPPQLANISYGVSQPPAGSTENPQTGFFANATPGAPNGGAAGLILPERVEFSLPSGPFTHEANLALSGASAGDIIRYTLTAPSAAGAIVADPTASSPIYSAPLALTGSVIVRAAVFAADGSRRGFVSATRYLRVDAGLATFATPMPVVIVDTHGAGALKPFEADKPAWFDLLGPADAAGTFTADPLLSTPALAHVRGATSANFPKKSFFISLLDANGRSDAESPLGLATDDTWDLVSPWAFDRAYFRNAYIYALGRRLGRWAPHTKFVEVFTGTGAGPLAFSDYVGVSVLTERITVDPDHVDLASLGPDDVAAPEITGGYILKIDAAHEGETTFATEHSSAWSPAAELIIDRPTAEKLQPAQRDYLRGYVQAMETALYADAAGGWTTHDYLNYLDRPSWIDYHIVQALSGNVDALRRSCYFTKDRGGKLVAGPLWDFDRSLGSADHRNFDWTIWNSADAGDLWNFGWWGVLARDPDFMQAWIDRWQALRRNELAADHLTALADQLAADISPEAAARDAARWPDDIGRYGDGWVGEVARVKTWAVNRALWIDQQFVAAPSAKTDGATVSFSAPAGAQLAYTLDGTDPRGANGQLAPTARVAPGLLVVDTAAPARVRAWSPSANRFPGSPWSGVVTRLDAAHIDAANADAAAISRLANLSSLVHVGPDDGAPLTGLVVNGLPDGTGAREKQFLVRGIGPGLRQFGMTDALVDPVLRVLDGAGREITRNAGWNLGADANQVALTTASVGAFQLADGSRDAALLIRLGPGAYTLAVDSASGQSGAALTEVYEIDSTGRLASLSTVASVNATHPGFSGGFTVRGVAPKKFLVRAVGPGLASLGVRGVLPDPQLTLFNYAGATTVGRNDDWAKPATSDAADATAIATVAMACGAFALPAGSKDAAVVVTLAPGAYTALVNGKADAAGLVLLEVYDVP